MVLATASCLCQLNEVPLGLSFSDYISINTDAVTTEVLGDEDILKLITSAEKEADRGADDAEAVEDSIPTPSQVMDAPDLVRQFAEGAEDALNVLASYEKFVQPLQTKHAKAKIADL